VLENRPLVASHYYRIFGGIQYISTPKLSLGWRSGLMQGSTLRVAR
jgi:hypothetical protein